MLALARPAGLPALALFLLAPGIAGAAPDHLERGRDVGHDAREAPDDYVAPDGQEHITHILFVNMDGANLTAAGSDNAPNDETVWTNYAGPYPAYGSAADKAAALEVVRSTYADYGLVIVGERPNDPQYSMIMLGPSGWGGGWATLDCGNENPNNIGFVDADPSWGAASNGAVVSHEAGHTFGLEHVDNYDLVMAPTIYEGAYFGQDCQSLISNSCYLQHDQYCGGGTQNSHEELLGMFGSNVPDMAPPEVAITSPADGSDIGPDFQIVAQASDDVGVTSATLWIDGMSIDTRSAEPWEWPVVQVPVGPHELQVVVTDAAGNEAASDVVEINVVDGVSTTGETSSGTDGDSTGSGPTSTGLPPDFGEDDEAGGCGCSTGHGERAGWMLLPLLGLGLRRRG